MILHRWGLQKSLDKFLKRAVWSRQEPSDGYYIGAGWSSPVAREAHNLEVVGSNPAPATYMIKPALVFDN